MHGTSIPPPNVHFLSAAGDVQSLQPQLKARFLFFSAGATILDNPLGIVLTDSLASPTTLIVVLLCLSVALDGSENSQVSIDAIPNYEMP